MPPPPRIPAYNTANTHFQYSPQKTKMSLKLKIGDQEVTEEGFVFSEATFISD
jgi:hypothetical protein